jgi:hypothetical protein
LDHSDAISRDSPEDGDESAGEDVTSWKGQVWIKEVAEGEDAEYFAASSMKIEVPAGEPRGHIF